MFSCQSQSLTCANAKIAISAPTLYGLAMCGAMGTINVTLIQCFVFGALIVAVDPVAVSNPDRIVGVPQLPNSVCCCVPLRA